MSDLDQRIADGLRALVDRAPVEADVWPATKRYVAKHRRHRRTLAGAVVAVALLAGVLVTVGVLGGAGSKAVVSNPSPTTEPQSVGPRGALAATGPIEGSFTITATPSGRLSFSPSAVTVTTGIYAVTLVSGFGAHTLNFDDPTTLWSELIVNAQGETKTSRIFFGQPGRYTFYCSIPGHRAAGEQGTVTVTGTPMTLAQAEAAATRSG
jgi:plastocyanin